MDRRSHEQIKKVHIIFHDFSFIIIVCVVSRFWYARLCRTFGFLSSGLVYFFYRVMVWLLFNHPQLCPLDESMGVLSFALHGRRNHIYSSTLILLIVIRCLFVFDEFADLLHGEWWGRDQDLATSSHRKLLGQYVYEFVWRMVSLLRA